MQDPRETIALHFQSLLDVEREKAKLKLVQNYQAKGQLTRYIEGGEEILEEIDNINFANKSLMLRKVSQVHVNAMLEIIAEKGSILNIGLFIVKHDVTNPGKFITVDGNHRLATLKECKRILMQKFLNDERVKSIKIKIVAFPYDASDHDLRQHGLDINATNKVSIGNQTFDYISRYIRFAQERNITGDRVQKGSYFSTSLGNILDEMDHKPSKNQKTDYIRVVRFTL